ncbi:GNAT family N-acetyltransferase [Enterovibrio sp. ZSDZ42]|uniref:GNAT family N-acetyltransferase n=1 Tax=Enterovibrio gelatinilyticus TaxID=2899819 RepID=A0ABT5R4I6_9GAMM|nr:GNAT family N-acetyltransferase [Enterovibrio sp. ZSDZ42]MDD1795189.1 GNAT family N-acetyltransferase [Enterovibrio sp. ZSDZ42]
MNLEQITKQNIYKVIKLSLSEQQQKFVSTNAFSMAESAVNPDYQPRAAVMEGEVVGFAMYTEWVNAVWMKEQKPSEYYIPRVMIDKSYQGKGYGRSLMELLLDEIKEKNPRAIHIVYCAKNTAAKNLYDSLGFVEYGKDDCGDILAKIQL